MTLKEHDRNGHPHRERWLERRERRRFPLHNRMSLSCRGQEGEHEAERIFSGECIDVSTGGMGVVVANQPIYFDLVHVSIEHHLSSIGALASIVRRLKCPRGYALGLRFSGFVPGSAERFEALISALAQHERKIVSAVNLELPEF